MTETRDSAVYLTDSELERVKRLAELIDLQGEPLGVVIDEAVRRLSDGTETTDRGDRGYASVPDGWDSD